MQIVELWIVSRYYQGSEVQETKDWVIEKSQSESNENDHESWEVCVAFEE